MKVSYNEIKKLTGLDVSIDDMVVHIGSRLGEVDGVEDLGVKYKDAIIVKIVECEKHPDADKLSLCMIDVGDAYKELCTPNTDQIQVVCGAPNVHADMYAVWLPPGATVPSSLETAEPFVLSAREIRSKVSNGMLASLKELGLGDSHDGILELTGEHNPGDSFAESYDLNDYIIDIENKMFTHRPDCFGLLGVAREVAGIFGQKFESPKWYHDDYAISKREDSSDLSVSIETDLVPRFSARILENVEVEASSLEMQVTLIKAGIRPINNIVDITNYVMHSYGQPLHAYDYQKIAERSAEKPTLVARMSRSGEKLKLLNGKEITLDKEAIVIATDKEVVGLAGIMGGADTEVDEKTTKIIFEAANFDMYSIRRSSMHYGIMSDAVTRFNKGQSPFQTVTVLTQAVDNTICYANGQANDTVYDEKSDLSANGAVEITAEFINSRLGSSLSTNEIKQILENTEFTVEVSRRETEISPDIQDPSSKIQDLLAVRAPFWRTDIAIKEDIVEEVGRMYGYDNLPLVLPSRTSKPTKVNKLLQTKSRIRQVLSALGANEVLTYSFVHRDLLQKVGQKPEDSYAVTNAISPDLHFYRQSLMPSLLDKVHLNIKAGHQEFAMFEIGKTHNKVHGKDESGIPGEIEVTSMLFASSNKARKGSAYYVAKTYLQRLADSFGVELEFALVPDATDYPITSSYDLSRSSLVSIKGGDFLGIVGEYKSAVTQAFKLPVLCAGFEIDTPALAKLDDKSPYVELSRYPSSDQDITLQTKTEVSYSDQYACVNEVLETSGFRYNLKPVSIYCPQEGLVNTSFSVSLSSLERTLTTSEVSAVISAVASKCAEKLGAKQL